MRVVRREEESFESLLRRFHKASEEIVADYKKHSVYVPKALRKKLKHEEALKRMRKEAKEKARREVRI